MAPGQYRHGGPPITQTLDSAGREKVTDPIPRGTIATFSGAAMPSGWLLCDGTNSTPDLRDRFIVGDTAIGLGSSGGTVSATAALTHAGAAVGAHSNHVVTQPSAHSDHAVIQPTIHLNHTITQANAHSTHAANATHTHDAHSTTAATDAATTNLSVNQHAANATHTHDAHSAHAGANLDPHSTHSGSAVDAHSAHSGADLDAHSAHSVTQPSSHAILKHYLLVLVMYAP